MDQQNQNQESRTTAPEEGAMHTAATASTAGNTSLHSLMAQSPMLAPVSGWLKCLRKPAISLQYSFRKRHIPDLDTASEDQQGGGMAGQAGVGQNSDTMDVTGGFTIRYFDLAAGAMGLMLLGCLWKGCCCLKRVMK